MADLRKVEVIFKNQTDGEKKPSDKVKDGDKNKVQETNKKDLTSIWLHQAWSYVKADIEKIATYELNKWFMLNDDYIGQRTVAAAMNVISKAKNIGVVTLAGFKLGGPVGAAIGLAGSLLTLGIDIAQNYERQDIQLRQMDAQLDYQRQRAGFSLTSGRVGENK